MFASATDVEMLVFFTLYDSDYAEGAQPIGWPLRFVTRYTAVTGPGGFIFNPALVDAMLPDEAVDAAPTLRIVALGPADQIIDELRGVPYAPTLKVELATFEDDTVGPVELTLTHLKLREAQVSSMEMTFSFA